ncbi:hypothetical protein GCM10010174_25980 [Kutzneria viridogrisea]|uniref:ParB/Sulfiredoxin domain-containing protein n=1 Tax=Kutzneria viridogrisea TaxID=47990 RepID=A0ABR6BRK3_9PSEU|nr:hypothetical protein [Kutzneria viridogrisea]
MKLDPPAVVRRQLKDLTLLDVNARYMRKETYDRLVTNLGEDGYLTSTPLIYSGDGEYAEGHELVLSGNHRVMAALEAGIEEADFLLIRQKLPKDRLTALQLSHNALAGEDDLATLKILYDGIEDIDYRQMAGLDDKTLDLLQQIDLESLSEANLDFQTITIAFLPPEADAARTALESLGKSADETWLAAYADYNPLLDALASAHSAHNVGNVGVALGILIGLAERHLTDLQAGFLVPGSAETRHRGQVGIEVVLGTRTIPAATAAVLTRRLKAAIDAGEVRTDKPWQLLDQLLAGTDA